MKKLSNFEKVKEFHEKFELDKNKSFNELLLLRLGLVTEEFLEVHDELYYSIRDSRAKDFREKLSKELSDLLYVVYGTAVTFGLPIDEVFDEVHKSNLSKLDKDGKPIYREDGKVLKGPNYKEPDLEQFFES